MVLLEGTGLGNIIIYDHGNNGFAVVSGGDSWAFQQDNGNEVDHFLL